jgi:formylglycine-generating enzyme required for sulfatase activity
VITPIPGGGIFCIDTYEVSYSDYLAFYNANPSSAIQPAACLPWNVGYTPSSAWPPAPADLAKPVRYVNWCDAYAYCSYVGKHLCGAITGGSNDMSLFADESESAWFDACSAQGSNLYPYGDVFSMSACNGAPSAGVAVETSFATCQGGSVGLFQMSGNVAEWEDSCSAAVGPNDNCRVRGGSYLSSDTDLLCDADLLHTRDYGGPEVGFRCCM